MNHRTRANGEGSIFPYRNGFAAYAWVTKPDGRRARKYVYGQTREIVHGKWLDLQQRAKQGPVATRKPTLAVYLGYWLQEVVRPNLAPLTYATRETFVRLYITPGLGPLRLDRLQVRDVQTWINAVAKACQCCAQGKDARRPASRRRCCAISTCCGDTPSARTVHDIRDTLRAALSHAAVEESVTKNVAAMVKLPPVRRHRGKAWSSEEARRFLESAKNDRDPLYAAYVLILVLGLRKGEVLGPAEDDVDPVGGRADGWVPASAGRPAAPSPADEDRGVRRHDAAARYLYRGAEGQGGEQSRSQGPGGDRVAGLQACVHHEPGYRDRATQLQPAVGRPGGPGRGPSDHGARRPADAPACSSTWMCIRG